MSEGKVVELGHGDVIGRIWSAALHISDPRISEMHAAVSLRGPSLRLMALRGRLRVKGQQVGDVELTPGLTVHLTDDVSVDVISVTLPPEVLAIEGPGVPQQILVGTLSFFPGTPVRIQGGFRPDAPVHLWQAGDGWTVGARHGGTPLSPGDIFTVGETTLRAVAVPLEAVPGMATVDSRLVVPLTLSVQPASVQIMRPGHAATVVDGVGGHLLAAVARAGEAEWIAIAAMVWPDEPPSTKLRGKFDVTRTRLRKRLRDADLRDDLVTVSRRGRVKLALSPQDVIRLT